MCIDGGKFHDGEGWKELRTGLKVNGYEIVEALLMLYLSSQRLCSEVTSYDPKAGVRACLNSVICFDLSGIKKATMLLMPDRCQASANCQG